MIKTAIDAVDIVYMHLKTSIVFTDAAKPNGELRRYQRALNSQKEDVVVNSLPINREFVQKGVLNVNVYVPNLVLNETGNPDYSQPNVQRLKELGFLVNQALTEVWSPDGTYQFEVQQDNLFPDENNQHYLNFRINFRNLTKN